MVVIRKPKKKKKIISDRPKKMLMFKFFKAWNWIYHKKQWIFSTEQKKNELMNMEDDKTNEPHKFIFNLSQRLNLTQIWVGLLWGLLWGRGEGGFSLSKLGTKECTYLVLDNLHFLPIRFS